MIIGAGHNSLVCAYYLAARGLKVTMLEARDIVGGAAVTEEFHPGFRNSTASYTVSLLHPRIIADMRLHAHGLRIVLRKIDNFLPTLEGDYLLAGRGGLTRREIARHSLADAENYDAYAAALNSVIAILRQWVLRSPPQCRRRACRPRRPAQAGQRCSRPCTGRAASPGRFFHQIGKRHSPPLFPP